jgi:AmmeMemoRadiSam system protein A
MSSAERLQSISRDDARVLLQVARDAIVNGFRTGTEPSVDPSRFSGALRELRATFVTVERDGDLMGCIGSLEPHYPLVRDVAKNAYAAIFVDPRCPPLRESDVPTLELHISILGKPEPMTFANEADLVRQLRPGIDGLILEDGYARGTFLPSVWDTLPEPHAFLSHLKMKAGLPPTYWSRTIRVQRYTTEAFSVADVG